MRRIIALFCIVLTGLTYGNSQNNIILEIDGEKITADEFLHIYKKNNTDENAMEFDSMKEYMDLFINFKLKVHEARKMGLDTSRRFINELNQYRSQLAQPYLTDKSVEKELIREAYERMKYDVNVSHILVNANQMALPHDTIKAFEKINMIHKKLQDGKAFEELALKYSEDPSVHQNNGNLGYRTVFSLVYPFETQMYNTQIGKFSKPFRTDFGYHILKVNDIRPAKGRYQAAHIMLITPEGTGTSFQKDVEDKIFDIYEQLKNGAEFAELSRKHSQDRRSAPNGGEIGYISVGGRMMPEFENLLFSLEKPGQISKPLKTSYGWHIIKLLDIESIKPFEEVEPHLRTRITNSARASKSKDVVLERIKKEYDLKVFRENVKAFHNLVTDSIFWGTWQIDENVNLSKPVASFNDKVLTQQDFYEYMLKFNRRQNAQPIKTFVDTRFDNFVDSELIRYEESILHIKYPEFGYLLNEYHDGILLFELTDQMVWSKAIRDTVGIKNFYGNNKDNYMWDYRYKTKIFECKDEQAANRVMRRLDKNRNPERLINRLNRKDNERVVETMAGKYEKGQNSEVDRLIRENRIPQTAGYQKVMQIEGNKVAKISVIPPEHKSLNEARGIITADYQNYLDKQWIKQLRDKYEIVLHENVLRKIAN